jgi:predicted secreted protein
MAKEIINGSKVLLKFSSSGTTENVVACSTSCVVNINQDFDSVVCKDTSTSWQQNTPKTKSWDMSIDGLYVLGNTPSSDGNNWSEIVSFILGSELVSVVLEVGGTVMYSGVGYFESTSLTANADENATFSASIKGNGELSIV